ncbi:MAG: 23S rRNA (guanosine(2251)-2'-O)-methyltransferase RlmB, partial [Alphaproteobacteria bacterium]
MRAALANPRRRCRRLLATEQALTQLREGDILPPDLPVEEVGREEIAARLAPGTAHQGLLLEVEPL